MTVQESSKMALEEYREILNGDKQAVFEAIVDLGPVHNKKLLEYLNQREMQKPKHLRRKPEGWHMNMINGRTNDLIAMKAIVDRGVWKVVWYGREKKYVHWSVWGETRQVPGEFVPPKEKTMPAPLLTSRTVRDMSASEAGRVLRDVRNGRPTKQKTSQIKQRQLQLF